MSKWVHLSDLLGEIGKRGVGQYHHQAAVHSGASARRSGWTGVEPTQKSHGFEFPPRQFRKQEKRHLVVAGNHITSHSRVRAQMLKAVTGLPAATSSPSSNLLCHLAPASSVWLHDAE